jgi:hypothetical protein
VNQRVLFFPAGSPECFSSSTFFTLFKITNTFVFLQAHSSPSLNLLTLLFFSSSTFFTFKITNTFVFLQAHSSPSLKLLTLLFFFKQNLASKKSIELLARRNPNRNRYCTFDKKLMQKNIWRWKPRKQRR